jgi:palmitoyl-protein thioesterase
MLLLPLLAFLPVVNCLQFRLQAEIPYNGVFSPSSPRPVVIWHGLGDTYDSDGMTYIADLINSTRPGTPVYSIRLDSDPSADQRAAYFGNLTTELSSVCDDLAGSDIRSAPGIDAVGFSQGGLFLRAYIQRCNAPPVRSLITFGSPHNGIAHLPRDFCARLGLICGVFDSAKWSSWLQGSVTAAQFFRDLVPGAEEGTYAPSPEYLESSNFLADINNEREEKSVEYAANVASLDHLVMVRFNEEQLITPPESTWFGEGIVTEDDKVWSQPLNESALWKEDWLGLRALSNKKDGLAYETVEGGHMQFTDEEFVALIEKYFDSSQKESKKMEL